MLSAPKTVLVVEDNPDWRELLVMVIRRLGFGIAVAHNGDEAVKTASSVLPELILMDLGLPKMNGDEATALLKANPATKDIPVVIQTAFGAGPRAERALQAGAAEVLHKPITIAQIENVLRKYLSNTPEAADARHVYPRPAVICSTRGSL